MVIPIRAAYFVCAMAAILAGTLGAAVGYHLGEIDGVKLAHDEQGIHVSENDKQMQRIGVCRFAAMMARNNKCQ